MTGTLKGHLHDAGLVVGGRRCVWLPKAELYPNPAVLCAHLPKLLLDGTSQFYDTAVVGLQTKRVTGHRAVPMIETLTPATGK